VLKWGRDVATIQSSNPDLKERARIPELNESQITEIVFKDLDAHPPKRFGQYQLEKHKEVDGTWRVYVFQLPRLAGGDTVYVIDESGKIVRRIPGK
jgi:hypothetical protein